MTTIILDITQKKPLSFIPKNALGNDSAIEAGSLKVELVQGQGGVTEVVDDKTIKFYSLDDLGGANTQESVYDVTGDADLGEGVVTITERVTVISTVAQAISFGVTEGAVETK